MTDFDEEPLDVTAVSADDELVERLRRSLSPEDAVVWGDDEDDSSEDRSYALLRALQLDVTAEAIPPAPAVAPVVPLAGRRRAFGRSATVAAVTTGVLVLGGAAAAATSAPGDAMYGVRSAVASAVQEVVDAITPAQPIGPEQARPTVATPTATITPPGAAVSAAARAAAALRQVEERIATAERLLGKGRARAALEVLEQAERRLPTVIDVPKRNELAGRIDGLQATAKAMLVRTASPRPQETERAEPSAKPERSKGPRPERTANANRGSDSDDDGRSEDEDSDSSGSSSGRSSSAGSQLPDVADDRAGSGPGRRDNADR